MSIHPAESFDWLAGDFATYSLNDPHRALELVRRHRVVAVDIETAGLRADAWTIKAVSIGTAQEAVVLDPEQYKRAIRLCIAEADEVLFHNAPYDVPILVVSGFMREADVWKVTDTLVEVRLAHPSDKGGNSLGEACERHLGGAYSHWKKSLEEGYRSVGVTKAAMWKVGGLHSSAYVAYAAFDIIMTARLHEALPGQIREYLGRHPFDAFYRETPEYLMEREQTINRMLLVQSCRGITVDLDVVDDIVREQQSAQFEADMTLSDAGVDVSATPARVKTDTMAVLDGLGALPDGHKRLANGLPSADKKYLAEISHPLVDALQVRSGALHFVTDYSEKLLYQSRTPDGRLHPQVSILAAKTGRMSYKEPPLQQFPASIRRMMRFDVEATSMDWASIEPVYAALVGRQADMIDEFEGGGDLYMPVAAAAGVDRKTAKVVLLAQLYGQGYRSLALRLGVSEDDAKEIIAAVMGRMPAIKKLIRTLNGVGKTHGLMPTMSGRLVPIDLDFRTGNHEYFGHHGSNYHIQGSCYDMLAEAIYAMHQQGLDDALLTAVHDELVVAAEAADQVEKIMTTPPPVLVEWAGRSPKLRIGRSELGRNWTAKQ